MSDMSITVIYHAMSLTVLYNDRYVLNMDRWFLFVLVL